jgi:hypothetical protein
MNRILVSIALLLLFTGCALPESEQLRKENVDLKAQLETVTQERDALKLQIDSIRKALEAPGVVPGVIAPGESVPNESAPNESVPGDSSPVTPNSSTPDSGTSDSGTVPPEVAPVNPGSSSDSGVMPLPSEVTPPEKMPETPAQPVAPQSTAPASPSPKVESGGAAVTTSPLYKYANEVVQAATNYRVQTQQAPPPDCSLGYSAGQNKVERSTQVKRCEVQSLENNQFKVRIESIDGSVVMAP